MGCGLSLNPGASGSLKGNEVGIKMNATLSIWGARGALPAADRQFLEYGGNTSCISLDWGSGVLCFDAGSGLPNLAERLSGTPRLDILISHVHIDHIPGLYTLSVPLGTEIHLYGAARQSTSFQQQLETAVGSPYWPVGLRDHSVQVFFHEIVPGDSFSLPRTGGELRICTMEGNHPGESLLYRAEFGESSVIYTLDCEMNEEICPASPGTAAC